MAAHLGVVDLVLASDVLVVAGMADAELAERKKQWQPHEAAIKTGYLAKYAAMATSADTGAVLKW